MKFMQNLSIRYKAYFLVAIGIFTAVLLLIITNIGLSSIKSKLDELVLSTNVERYAYLTILEEKNYLLNANASVTNAQRALAAFENAKKDVETINSTLDKIDSTSSNKDLLDKSKTARSGTNEYKELYYKGVDLLVNIGKETEKLEHEGELATLQAQEYVLEKRKQLDEKLDATLVKKTNIATDIWKLTYVIRADEKRYMLNPNPVVFERMKNDFAMMLAHLETLKKMASDNKEQEKITVFHNAAKSYETAAYNWVDLNKNLMSVVLPKMKSLGDTVVKQAMEAAEAAQANMVQTRNEIVMTLLIIAGIAIVLGFLMAQVTIRLILETLGGEPTYAASIVKEVAKGNLSVKVQLATNDKTSLLYSIDKMRETLSNIIVSTNIVMADTAKGSLSSRMEGQFSGEFVTLQKGINTSLDTLSETLDDVMRVANALANGNLHQKITKNYQGAFAQTKDAMNNTVETLNKLIEEIDSIVYSGADCGDFSVKMTMHDKVGYGKRLAELINQLFETTEKSLSDVLRISQTLASGDLTQKITADYVGAFAEVKVGMNATVDNLKTLLGEIKMTSEIIATASNEISAGNHDLSHRTETQASNLQQTAASMEELSTAVQQNMDNVKHANQLAEGASGTAIKGVEVVNKVVKTMSTINESSHKIVDIISVIDDIAFQTNILALNAAVEAARAGDSGKGFAVVAVEVRNLAQRAANAAGEIKRLISDSVENISDGTKQVEQAGKTMEDIVSAIKNVSAIMSEIAAASTQQNAGINQVHDAVSEIDGITQQNAALVEEAAAAAQSLSEQTKNLANGMAHFKTDAKQLLDFNLF